MSYDVKLSAVGLRTELLSGNANFAGRAATPRLDFNRADSVIVCVAMKIRIKNGNTLRADPVRALVMNADEWEILRRVRPSQMVTEKTHTEFVGSTESRVTGYKC